MSYRINRSLLGGVFALTLSATALGAGFQNNESNVSHLGTAFSGTTASCYDASTAFLNPAGITCLNKHQLMAAGTFVYGDFDYKHLSGTSPAPLSTAMTAATDDANDNPGVPSVIPAFHYTKPLTDRLGFGFSVTAPFGLATEYDTDAIQRYLATLSQISTVDLNPSVAFKFNDHFSIGGGVSAQYADAKLRSVSNVGTGDFETRLAANDWGYGWNLGLLAKFNEDKTRVGLSYRSKIKHELEGKAKFKAVTVDPPASPLFVTQDINGVVTLPETVTGSLFQSLTPKFELLMDVAFTNWSRFKELRINFPDTGLPDTSVPENFQDTWRYSLGGNYHVNDNWSIKAGYMYDESPVRDADRTSRLPDSDRHLAAVGLQYKTNSDKFIFDVGYAYILFEKDARVTEGAALLAGTTTPSNATTAIDGKYDGHAHLFGVQAAWNL